MALLTSKTRVKPKFSAVKRQEEAKKSRQDELDDLIVVGYACKLFRDDVRAREIDRGTHLIPWMGDDSLKIDRYDGRGHLHTLRDFDQMGWNEDEQLSSEAARIEAICDEERYMALHTDLLEEQTRQEEELKRLNEAITADGGYMSVAFSYGTGTEDYDPMQPTEDETETTQSKLVSHENQPPPSYRDEDATPAAELEEPFIAPPELKLPPGMEQPQTLKIHVIIEKTAMFVANHGPQMEIIVKTKQANNPQFDFLKFDHYLNPYYKLVMAAIKSKLYIPTVLREGDKHEKKKQGELGARRNSNSNSIQSDDEEDDMEGSGYLHPSLFAPPRPKPAAVQIQHHPPPGAIHAEHIPPHMGPHQGEMFPLMDPQQPQLIGYYDGVPTTTAPFPMGPMLVPPPPPPDHIESGNPVPLGHPMGPMPPGFMPAEPLPGPGLPLGHPALVQPPMHETQPLPMNTPASVLGPPLISQEMPIPPAADESAIEPQLPPIVPPPPDIQPIIDKLARYVAKNGDDFEASVRTKRDPRFEFLVPWHSYNAYYLAKKQIFIQELSQEAEGGGARDAADKSKKVPVRFPIKPKRGDERTLGRKSALPVESSSDSDNDQDETNKSTSSCGGIGGVGIGNQQAKSMAIYGRGGNPPRPERPHPLDGRGEWGPPASVQYGGREAEGGDSQQYGSGVGGGGGAAESHYAEEDIAMMQDVGNVDVDQYDDGNGFIDDGKELGKHGNQQRLEDRLAMAARKKLASASQERSLQVERRKKLALFLSQVKDRPQAGAAAQDLNDAERELQSREETDRYRVSYGKPRSPHESERGERTASPPSRSTHGESRSNKRAPPVPKSYQKAVNREVLERERRRKRHSRSPSPRKVKRKSPPPHPLPPMSAGSSAIIGRASSASPVMSEPVQERDLSVPSPSSDTSLRISSQPSTQTSGSEVKAEPKGGTNDLRAKIRAMLAATMDLRQEEIG